MVTATAMRAGSVLLRNRGDSGRLRGCLRSSPQRCQGRSARHAHSRVSGTSRSLDWNFERLREDYPDGHCESGAVIVPEEWTIYALKCKAAACGSVSMEPKFLTSIPPKVSRYRTALSNNVNQPVRRANATAEVPDESVSRCPDQALVYRAGPGLANEHADSHVVEEGSHNDYVHIVASKRGTPTRPGRRLWNLVDQFSMKSSTDS
jgi:hypothetical protein